MMLLVLILVAWLIWRLAEDNAARVSGGHRRARTWPWESPTCPRCGAAVREDFKVCPSCGFELRRDCPSCGRPVQPGWTYCPHCSTKLSDVPSKPDIP